MKKVYITDTSSFLPNRPIDNDQMEHVLGALSGLSKRVKRIILRNNGIKTRYYAIDPDTGAITHTNAEMTAEAIRRLRPYHSFTLDDIEILSCGTSTPDQLMPGHASMVHGCLGNPPCEVISTSGICCSGIAALKYACSNIAAGFNRNAVVSGSDIASTFTRSRESHALPEDKPSLTPEDDPSLAFNAEFLRWMMSDGAGAMFLSDRQGEGRLSLRIDWIEFQSFANELEPCMYAGATKQSDGSLKGWREFQTWEEALGNQCFMIQQDVRLLNKEIIKTAVDRMLPSVLKRHDLSPSDIDWFLPHYSSEYFRAPFYKRLKEFGFEIPYEKWFTNLATKGNTGAASFFIILDELYHSGNISGGDHLLCFIPESGRFTMSYMMLTAIEG